MKGEKVKTWECTEVQGRGRRYWFPDSETARKFYFEKRKKGYLAVMDSELSKTVWVPFSKKMNTDIQDQLQGKDPVL
jgi:hypothetical protein